MDIKDKIAVVTGAGKGIGRAISEMLIKRGAFVVLVARRIQVLEELQSELDPKKESSLVISTDISEEKQVIDLFERIRGELGSIQILIMILWLLPVILAVPIQTWHWLEKEEESIPLS